MRAKYSPNRAVVDDGFHYIHAYTYHPPPNVAANDEDNDVVAAADDDECNCRFYWLYG